MNAPKAARALFLCFLLPAQAQEADSAALTRLREGPPEARLAAAVQLIEGGREDSWAALVEALSDDERLDHRVAAMGLAMGRNPGADPSALVEGLALGTKARTAAAWELSGMRGLNPEVSHALLQATGHPDKHARNFTVFALAMTARPSRPLVARLVEILSDPGVQDPPQRNYKYPQAMAAIALGCLGSGDAAAAAALERAAANGDAWVVLRDSARWALRRIANQAERPALQPAGERFSQGLTALGRYAGNQTVSRRDGTRRAPAVHESISLAVGYLRSLGKPPTPREIDGEETAGRMGAAAVRYVMALGGVQQGIAPALLHALQSAEAQPPARRVFKTIGERQLQLAVHYPEGWKPGGSRTGIVFFSGAHRVMPDKDGKVPPLAAERAKLGLPVENRGPGEAHAPFCDALAKRGYVCMRAEYRTRGRDGVLPGEDIPDALSAMRWVCEHAAELGVDPGRVVAGGGSSGAYLAASTFAFEGRFPGGGGTSARPNAILLYSPLVDWLEVGSMSKAFLVVLNGDKARGEAYSPARHWSAGAPPTLVLVGADEPPIAAVRSFGERWRAEGARIELFVADGAPHGFFAQPRWIEDTLARTVRFLAALGL